MNTSYIHTQSEKHFPLERKTLCKQKTMWNAYKELPFYLIRKEEESSWMNTYILPFTP